MTRRSTTDGTVAQRPNGRWEARIWVELDRGKKRVSGSGRTRKEALERAQLKRDRLLAGAPVKDATITVREWFTSWRDGSLQASGRSQSTKDQYETLVRTHVLPTLGSMRLAKVRASDVEQLFAAMDKAASTKRSTYAGLRDMFDVAVRDQLIQANPVTQVKRPTGAKPKQRALSSAEVRTLLRAVEGKGNKGVAVRLVANTGLRRGEVLALRWCDIDFNSQPAMVSVNGTINRTSDGLKRSEPKTAKSYRRVPIDHETASLLKSVRTSNIDQAMKNDVWFSEDDYIFTAGTGGPIEPRNFARWYEKTCRELGLSDTGFHALRHYAATKWLQTGRATVRDIADLLGHSSPVVTLEIYAAAVPESQVSVVLDTAETA